MQFHFSLMSQSDAEKSRIGIMKVSTPFTIWKTIPKTCKNFFPQKNVAKITGVFFQTEF